MSWRNLARAYLDRTDHEVGVAERAAIVEVDGGLPADWARALIAIETGPRPTSISERDWRERLDHLWRRADEHGAAFVRNGWTFDEVFGVGANWNRLDQRGALWLAPSMRIVSVDAERIIFDHQGKQTECRRLGRIN
jgi:hypothetical protein